MWVFSFQKCKSTFCDYTASMTTVKNITSNILICFTCNWQEIRIYPAQEVVLDAACLTKLQSLVFEQGIHWDTITSVSPKTVCDAMQWFPTWTVAEYIWLDSAWECVKWPAVPQSATAPWTVVNGGFYYNTTQNVLYTWVGWVWVPVWNEVQSFATFAWFPATWTAWVIYIDLATDTSYVWDTTTSAYITIPKPNNNPIVRNYVTTPTSVVNFPTTPTVVNAWGKDIYRATVTYTVTAPTNTNSVPYFYTISTKGRYQIDKINYPVSAYSYILWTWISQSAEEELNIPVANSPINYQKLSATWYVTAGWSVTITNVYEIRIDTGQSVQMVWWSAITMTNTTAEFIYYPEY